MKTFEWGHFDNGTGKWVPATVTYDDLLRYVRHIEGELRTVKQGWKDNRPLVTLAAINCVRRELVALSEFIFEYMKAHPERG